MSNRTQLEELKVDDDSKDFRYQSDANSLLLKGGCSEEDDILSIYGNALNLFLPGVERLQSLVMYHALEQLSFGELLNRIIGMYNFSQTKVLREYLGEISTCRELPLIYRIECAKNLEEYGYPYLNSILLQENHDMHLLPTPIKVSTVMYLAKSGTHPESCKQFFQEILNDNKLEELSRIKIIQDIEKNTGTEEEFLWYARDICQTFIENPNIGLVSKIIVAQYMHERCKLPNTTDLDLLLLSIAQDPLIEYNIRGDAVDVILRYGSESIRHEAMKILNELGGGIESRNIFKNAQNVHNLAIVESVERIIDKLCLRGSGSTIFEESVDDVRGKFPNEAHHINLAIGRVTVDRAVYGKANVTLRTIFTLVWSYIQKSEHRLELEKRFAEELVESSGKCSSGFASHQVNTLSGFDEELTMHIGYENQIIAIFEVRLSGEIKKIAEENKELAETILEEMTVSVLDPIKRKNFLSFFKQFMPKIRDSLYREFIKNISSHDFDLYMRKAISHYEGYHE